MSSLHISVQRTGPRTQRVCAQTCSRPGVVEPLSGHWGAVPMYCRGLSGERLPGLSRVQLSVTPWTAARQAFLSIANSWSLLKLASIESVMPSNHLILCCPLLLLPSIFPSIRVFK